MKTSEKARLLSKSMKDLDYLREEFDGKSSPSDRDGLIVFDLLVDFVESNQYNLEHLIEIIRDMERAQ